MNVTALVLMLTLLLLPALSDARCRTVGESASVGTEYGTFPLYPAKRVLEAGERRDSVALQWVGYGIGLPLFVRRPPVLSSSYVWSPGATVPDLCAKCLA